MFSGPGRISRKAPTFPRTTVSGEAAFAPPFTLLASAGDKLIPMILRGFELEGFDTFIARLLCRLIDCSQRAQARNDRIPPFVFSVANGLGPQAFVQPISARSRALGLCRACLLRRRPRRWLDRVAWCGTVILSEQNR